MEDIDSDDDPFDALAGGKARRKAIAAEAAAKILATSVHVSGAAPRMGTFSVVDAEACAGATIAEAGKRSATSVHFSGSDANMGTDSGAAAEADAQAIVAEAAANGSATSAHPSGATANMGIVSGAAAARASLAHAFALDQPATAVKSAQPSSALLARQQASAERLERIAAKYRRIDERRATILSMVRPARPLQPIPDYGVIFDNALVVTAENNEHVFAHAIQTIVDGMATFGSFKIGISSCPAHRMYNNRYGYYSSERWQCMVLAVRGPARWCQTMERFMIKYGKATFPDACFNVAPGGEGVSTSSSGDYWCYVVFDMNPRGSRGCDWCRGPYPRARELYLAHLTDCSTCQRYEREDASF